MAHPRAAGLRPVAARGERLQGLRHAVARGVRLPGAVAGGAVAGGEHRPSVDEAAAVADQAGDRADGAALADDHRLALGFDVPHVGQGERQHLARIEVVVGFLRLAGDAVEQVVDGEAVRARFGAGTRDWHGRRRSGSAPTIRAPGRTRRHRRAAATASATRPCRCRSSRRGCRRARAARPRAGASRSAASASRNGRPIAVAGGAVPSSAASVGTTSCCETGSFETSGLMNGAPYSSSGMCVS